MRLRRQNLGDRNISGSVIEKERAKRNMRQGELLAKLQILGIDISAASLSKIEGQIRHVTDRELRAFSKVFGVSSDRLLGQEKKRRKNFGLLNEERVS